MVPQLRVQWDGFLENMATWEDEATFRRKLEDKLYFKRRGISCDGPSQVLDYGIGPRPCNRLVRSWLRSSIPEVNIRRLHRCLQASKNRTTPL
jgi:hypothetical protein